MWQFECAVTNSPTQERTWLLSHPTESESNLDFPFYLMRPFHNPSNNHKFRSYGQQFLFHSASLGHHGNHRLGKYCSLSPCSAAHPQLTSDTHTHTLLFRFPGWSGMAECSRLQAFTSPAWLGWFTVMWRQARIVDYPTGLIHSNTFLEGVVKTSPRRVCTQW